MFWSGGNKYSKKQKQITTSQIKRLASWAGLDSLKKSESELVVQALLKRRGSDGDISLYQVYEVLSKLEDQNKISKYDKEGIMNRFADFLT